MIRVLVADAQAQVRRALRLLLEEELRGQVQVDEARQAEEAATIAAGCPPDLVLLDWGLVDEGQSSRAASPAPIQQLRQACPQATLLVLSLRPEAGPRAVAAGADGFIDKTESPDRLLALIQPWIRSAHTQSRR